MSHFLRERELLLVTDGLHALLDGRDLAVPRITLIFSPISRFSNKYEFVSVLFLKPLDEADEVIKNSDLLLHRILLPLLDDGVERVAHHCDEHI